MVIHAWTRLQPVTKEPRHEARCPFHVFSNREYSIRGVNHEKGMLQRGHAGERE